MSRFCVKQLDGVVNTYPLDSFALIVGERTPLYCREVITDYKGSRSEIVLENVLTCDLIQMSYETYKVALRGGRTMCINYQISKSGKFVKKAMTVWDKTWCTIMEYNHMQYKKQRVLGLTFKPDEYRVLVTGEVQLKQANNIVNNVYYIPSFVTGLVIGQNPETTESVFSKHKGNLKVINRENRIKVMDYMFAGCMHIPCLDLTEFSTTGCVSMNSMFSKFGPFNNNTVEIRGIEKFNVTDVQSMANMFASVVGVSKLDLSAWNAYKVNTLRGMFEGCLGLRELNVSTWNVAYCSDFSYMFSGCISLKSLNIGKWNTTCGRTFECMFYKCTELSSLKIGKWNMEHAITCKKMFARTGLVVMDLSGWKFGNNIDNLSMLFDECALLESVVLDNLNVTTVTDMSYMFNWCKQLVYVSFKGWNTKNVRTMLCMFCGCTAIAKIPLQHFNTAQVTSMQKMFSYCTNLGWLDLSAWQLSSVNNLDGMFAKCVKLRTIQRPVEHFINKKATTQGIFELCDNLQEYKIYDWELNQKKKCSVLGITYKPNEYTVLHNGEIMLNWCYPMNDVYTIPPFVTVVDIAGGWSAKDGTRIKVVKHHKMRSLASMFSEMSVEEIDLTEFEFCGEDISRMFENCRQLKRVHFGESKPTEMQSLRCLFAQCNSLESLDLSGWDTSKVFDMSAVFTSCVELKTLDLSGWSFESVRKAPQMFNGCGSLRKLVGADIRELESKLQREGKSGMYAGCNAGLLYDLGLIK